MPGSQSLSKPQIFTYDLADANLTGFASNVTGANWTLTRNSATDGLAHQVSIRNDSANNKSGIDITLVGTDPDGNALTETIAGPTGSATVETTGYFYTLTSVTPASTWGADTADIGWVDEISSQTIALNHLAEDTTIINVNVTGTVNFTVQQTFDNVLSSRYSAPAQQVQWANIAASQAADNQWYADGGALAVRVLVNSYSSGAELSVNVNQTYVSSNSSGGGGGGGDVNLTEIGGNPVSNTTPGVLDVNVLSGGGSNSSVSATGAAVPADATFVGAQDGSGNLVSLRGTAADGLLVNLGANNDVTITGTVAATQSGTWNVGTVTTVTTVTTLTGTTSLTPGTGAANLGKAEDAAHASGDTGVMALAVRRDTASAFGADGDYTPFRVDQYGDLNVRVVDNTGAGLAYNSNGITTAANSSPVVNAAASSLTINQVAMSSTAAQIVASNSNRRFVTVLNQGSGLLYVNTSSGVTTSNGFMLTPGAAKDFYATTAVYGITPTGQTSVAGYSEEAS